MTTSEMTVIYAGESFPEAVTKAIFLAGPTPRDPSVGSWRPEALRLLGELGYDGHVFVPENRDQGPYNFQGQVEWEKDGLHRADSIVFWVPRDMATMPALTTNIEWGLWCDSGKAVFGAPDSAENIRYMKWQCDKLKVPMFNGLRETLEHSVNVLGAGELRKGGEAQVPLYVWQHPTFRAWYETQWLVGNRLDGANVLWTFRVGAKRQHVFAWAVQVNVWVQAEQRHKSNEVILGRLDIACVVLHTKENDIVLVREFRSPARNHSGYITELPGGGITGDDRDPVISALKELQEETGFSIAPHRLRYVRAAQVAGTFSTHTASVFSAQITAEELAQINRNEVHGVAEDGEFTTVVVAKYEDLLAGTPEVDWATLGMIVAAVS